MSIFSKKINRRSEPEDLDSGYENPYYSVREDRRDDRRDDRRSDEDYFDTRRSDDRAPRGDYYEEERPSRGGYEEEEPRGYRERMYEEEVVRRQPEKAPEKPAAPENKGTLYYTPESYRDVRVEIVTALKDCHVVVINIRNLTDTPDLVRLVDYLMGAVQVLGATLSRVNGNNLVLVPAGVELDEEELLLSDEEETFEEEYGEDYDEDYEDYDEE